MPEPIPLAAVVTTQDGRVLGFTDEASCREWLVGNVGYTAWTADGFWRRESDERGRHVLISPAGVTRELTTEELREALARVTAERDYCRGRWTAELVNRLLDTTGINRASAEVEAESRVAAGLREFRKAYDEPPARGE